MEIQAIAFDVDGTLYPSIRMYIRAFCFFIRNPILTAKFYRVRNAMRFLRPIHDFKQMQAQLLAESMNIDTEEAYRRIEGIMYRKWEKIFETIKPYASIPPVLEDLKKRGFKLAVLSDFPVNTKLAYLDLEGFWDCALASEEAGYLKPNPEPFMLLAECLDLRPEQILYVGNSYEYDIVGANKAGMKTGYFAKRGKKPGKADIIFSSYKNLVLNIEEKMGNM